MQRRKLLLRFIIVMLIDKFEFVKNDDQTNPLDDYLKLSRHPGGNNIVWPSKDVEDEVCQKGKYDPRDVIVTRFQFYKDGVFLIMPKYRSGVPFSLGRMSMKDGDHCNPKVYPYPCWSDHDENSEDPIRNAVDVFLDTNNILWILDVGIINSLEDPKMVGPPKAIGIDPISAKVKYKLDLQTLVSAQSRLQFVVAEANGDKTTVFISDAGSRSIIVYDVVAGKGFRVVLPEACTHDSPTKDVLYLLMAFKSCGESSLYFTYLSGKSLFTVKTSSFRLGKTLGSIITLGVKPGKMVLLGTDSGQNIFFRYQGGNTIYLWNVESPFHSCNFIVIEKPKYCRLGTHVINGYRKLMWVLESNFHDYISGRIGCLGADSRIHPLLKHCEEFAKETDFS